MGGYSRMDAYSPMPIEELHEALGLPTTKLPLVVLGGGLSNIDELYTRGRAAVERYVFNDELRTPIVRHTLGDSAGVIGAALLLP